MRSQKSIKNVHFEGVWRTEDNSIVEAGNGVIKIIESPFNIFKGMYFPIDDNGKCLQFPCFNLVERQRTCHGYEL